MSKRTVPQYSSSLPPASAAFSSPSAAASAALAGILAAIPTGNPSFGGAEAETVESKWRKGLKQSAAL